MAKLVEVVGCKSSGLFNRRRSSRQEKQKLALHSPRGAFYKSREQSA